MVKMLEELKKRQNDKPKINAVSRVYINRGFIKDWYWANRTFLHSNKQWCRVKIRVDKITANVLKCPPQPGSGAIVVMH